MLSTDMRAKGERKKAEAKSSGSRRASGRVLVAFCLLPFALFLSGCRRDMQDQPRYEVYETNTFFADGQASRPLVEGTVPRGARFRDPGAYQYSGQMAAGGAGGGGSTRGGAQSDAASATGATGGAQMGGVGAGGANVASTSGGAQPTGDVNVRGNVAGGIPLSANIAGGLLSGDKNSLAASGAGGRTAAGQSGGGAVSGAGATGGADVFPFQIDEAVLARGQERFNAYCSMCHGMTGEGDGMIVRRGFRRPPSFHEDKLQPGNASAAHIFDVITNGWGAMPDYAAQIPWEDRWRIIAYVRALQLSRRATVADVPAEMRNRIGTPQTNHAGGQAEHGGQEH